MIKGKKEAKKYIRAKDSSGPLFGPSSRATPGLNQAKCSHKTEGLSKINSAFVNSSKPRFSQLGPGQNLRCEISGNSALLLATPRVSNSHLLEREGSPSAEEGKALFPERRNSIEPKARALNTRMQYNKLEKMQTCADVSQILTAKGYSSGSPKIKKIKKQEKVVSQTSTGKFQGKKALSTSIESKISRDTVSIKDLSSNSPRLALRRHPGQQQNVKVIARIRPLNQLEGQLIDNAVGSISCSVYNSNTVHFPEENQTISLDYIFDQAAAQEEVYNITGRETIEDVLKGYNGTIFAYGQTGSGKTYTMFGTDIYDDELKGIIPRAANDIFNMWDTTPDVQECDIHCSMLEIYKEELRDLLMEKQGELKIKESPTRGVFVEGLLEVPVASEEELMDWIDTGETRRVWAETKHNAVSSRSHTILMLEVRQNLNNGSELRGILNLVDLAGSEKVGKSGAQGELFKEGTKINLSLSALGNVIHALTSNLDHVPYRDSKLTRLLQESLGGNYKTTLIVTCSPHSSSTAESINSLRFAQRAKRLKNRVTINVKNSADQLMKQIAFLKEELLKKNAQIVALLEKGRCLPLENRATSSILSHAPPQNDIINLNPCRSKSALKVIPPEIESNESLQSTNEMLQGQIHNLEQENIRLQGKLSEAIQRAVRLGKEKEEVEAKLHATELSLVEEKKRLMEAELKLSQKESEKAQNKLGEEKRTLKDEEEASQINILQKQIEALNEALEDAENECFKLLKEKKEKINKEVVNMYSLSLLEYVRKQTIQTSFTDKWVGDVRRFGLDLCKSFVGPKSLFSSSVELKLDEKLLNTTSKYASSVGSAVMEGKLSNDMIIYLLKNELINAAVMNHNLKRVISLLTWKLYVEKSNASIKIETCKVLQKRIDSLEAVLAAAGTRQQAMRGRFEKLDYELSQLKEQANSSLISSRVGSFINAKPRIRKPIKIESSFRRLNTELRSSMKADTPSHFTKMPRCTPETGSPVVREVCEVKGGYNFSSMREESLKKEYEFGKKISPERFQSEVKNLEGILKETQIDFTWQKTLASLLMQELIQTRQEGKTYKEQAIEIKASCEQVIEDENRNWQQITNTLKENFDQELSRKQKEIASLNELLAEWIFRYMEIEKSHPPSGTNSRKSELRFHSTQPLLPKHPDS